MKQKKSIKVGDKIGRLKVLEIIRPTFYVTAKVQCKCGTVKTVQLQQLFRGTKSCGCLRKEVARERGKKIAAHLPGREESKKLQKKVNKRESKALNRLKAWVPGED